MLREELPEIITDHVPGPKAEALLKKRDEALPKALPAHLMRSAKVPPIKKAKHGDSGGVRGAAALFLNCE